MKRKKISDVFTPRSAKVNMRMYINRDSLEGELLRKLRGSQNVIVHGESGCGKSWLYKKVFLKHKIPYKVINLAYAESNGSILSYLESESRVGTNSKVEYLESKEASGNIAVAQAKLIHQNKYVINTKSSLFAYLERFFNKKPGFICLENLEIIFSNSLMMKELANLIIMLDDEDFAAYQTKFLIVGVPANILEYFSQSKNLSTVANRLVEVSEVKPMSQQQVFDFVNKGFIEELKIQMDDLDLDLLKKHIFYITGGVPQRMHEYSEILAYLIEERDWYFDAQMLDIVNKQWLLDSLYKNYEVILKLMNSENTTIGRRNQVLYCLGMIDSKTFTLGTIEDLVRREFPNTCKAQALNLSIPLGDIAEAANPIIMKSGKSFVINDMKYILCLRAMLIKRDEKVSRVDLNHV